MSIDELAAFIDRRRPQARREGYSADVRRLVCASVSEQRAAGTSWAALANQLRLSTTTLQRWHDEHSDREAVGFSPVVIRELAPATKPYDVPCERTLHLPGGVHITGLTLADVITLVRDLQ